jgi:sugar phosphate isomerase/epimerase
MTKVVSIHGWKVGAAVSRLQRLNWYTDVLSHLEINLNIDLLNIRSNRKLQMETLNAHSEMISSVHLSWMSLKSAIKQVPLINELGAGIGVIHPFYPKSTDEFLGQLYRFAEAAEKFDVKIAVENICDRSNRCKSFPAPTDPIMMAELLEKIGSERLGLCLDTCHALDNGIGKWDTEEIISRLIHVHLSDSVLGGHHHLHGPITEETKFMEHLLQLLSMSRHKGSVMLENRKPSVAIASYKYVNSLSEAN